MHPPTTPLLPAATRILVHSTFKTLLINSSMTPCHTEVQCSVTLLVTLPSQSGMDIKNERHSDCNVVMQWLCANLK